uniref:Targeting protein for Xklp2 n=1 Tax=Timema monikensis TaxID=170555 RepID=A0A7R9HM13_9NEOP|nr:unnamed protein product [Timema monikensis]
MENLFDYTVPKCLDFPPDESDDEENDAFFVSSIYYNLLNLDPGPGTDTMAPIVCECASTVKKLENPRYQLVDVGNSPELKPDEQMEQKKERGWLHIAPPDSEHSPTSLSCELTPRSVRQPAHEIEVGLCCLPKPMYYARWGQVLVSRAFPDVTVSVFRISSVRESLGRVVDRACQGLLPINICIWLWLAGRFGNGGIDDGVDCGVCFPPEGSVPDPRIYQGVVKCSNEILDNVKINENIMKKKKSTPLKLDGPNTSQSSGKKHQMLTRLDKENTPLYSLRSRNVERSLSSAGKAMNTNSSKKNVLQKTTQPSSNQPKRAMKRRHLISMSRFESHLCELEDAHEPTPHKPWVFKPTIPVTPGLTSHLRTRPVHYPTREQEEEATFLEMKNHQVKAYPLNTDIFKQPKLGIRVEAKQHTIPEPFNLTEIKKKEVFKSPQFAFKARPISKGIMENVKGIPEKKPLPATKPVTPKLIKRRIPLKVFEDSVEVIDGKTVMKPQEVFNFGVPQVCNKRSTPSKRMTEVKPFSFEKRDIELQKKKDEKIKAEVALRVSHSFLMSFDRMKPRSGDCAVTINFLIRGNHYLYVQWQQCKVFEQEKKARIFHANPVPQLCQDLTKGLFTDVSNTTNESQDENMKATFRARPAKVLNQEPFVPKPADRRPLIPVDLVLNTESRAKVREEFNQYLKERDDHIEQLRAEERARQKEKEKREAEEMKKVAESFKARPKPKYKLLNVKASSVSLTKPCSPHFSVKCHNKSDN